MAEKGNENVLAEGQPVDAHIAVILEEIIEGQPGEKQAGIREFSPAKEPLSGGEHFAYMCANIVCFLIPVINLLVACGGCITVQPMTAVIVHVFEKVLDVKMNPGLQWIYPLLTTKMYVSLRMESLTVTNECGQAFQVPDATGSPMNVNTMVNYVIDDPVSAEYNVENLKMFINNQAFDVVRRMCGRFKFKSPNPMEISLLNHSHIISKYMKKMLQKRCAVAGVEILRMDFIEISYDSSMAQQLLQTNKAQARIDARKLVVEGAVAITHGAITRLDAKGIELDERDRAELTNSLMCLTCSDNGSVQPIIEIV